MSSDINRYEPSGSLRRNKRVSGHQLSRLHTFEAAARHCSFALAAQELALTPGAVSHRINTLESELGFRLVNGLFPPVSGAMLADSGDSGFYRSIPCYSAESVNR